VEISFIPRWLIRCFSDADDYLKLRDINILISNLLIILIFIVFKNHLMSFLNLLPHFCLFDKLTGVECPVCGTIRAFCEIAKGNWVNASNLNVAGYSLAIYFVLQVPIRVICLLKSDLQKRLDNISKYLGYIVLLIFFVSWVI